MQSASWLLAIWLRYDLSTCEYLEYQKAEITECSPEGGVPKAEMAGGRFQGDKKKTERWRVLVDAVW